MPDRYFFTVPGRRHPAAFRSDARARRPPAGLPPSAFSRSRVQRVHRRDARPAGTVLDDRGRADRQQSQHPVGANHHARRRHRAGRVSRLASDGRRRRWRWKRTAGCASSATSSASSPASRISRQLVAGGAARAERRRASSCAACATEVTRRQSHLRAVHRASTCSPRTASGCCSRSRTRCSSSGMRIHLARISTNADQALDVFYVSDRDGGKVDRPRSGCASCAAELCID